LVRFQLCCLLPLYFWVTNHCFEAAFPRVVRRFRRCANVYRGADKSLAPSTSGCILFDGENISFDAILVIYKNSTNIPPIMIINSIYETQKSSVAVTCFLPGRAKDLSAPLYLHKPI
jgi:hypothetical protein